MQGSQEGKRAKLWGPRAHFGANISMKILKYLLWEKYCNYRYYPLTTAQDDRFATSCENIVSRSQTSSLKKLFLNNIRRKEEKNQREVTLVKCHKL